MPWGSACSGQQADEMASGTGTTDGQRSNEPLLPHSNVYDVGIAAKLPRLKQTRLKTIAVDGHGIPKIQRKSGAGSDVGLTFRPQAREFLWDC